jgi:ribosomal protein S18 acetylase RimI-like enzyme
MNLIIQQNCSNIDWNLVPRILELGNMGFHEASVHQKAFENSASVVFIFDGTMLVGFGRAISDGAYQAAIFDVAILPEYQGKGIGRLIIDKIVESLPGCNFILYAAPGKEKFYEKLNFRKMKTGMGLFVNAERMQIKGMIE